MEQHLFKIFSPGQYPSDKTSTIHPRRHTPTLSKMQGKKENSASIRAELLELTAAVKWGERTWMKTASLSSTPRDRRQMMVMMLVFHCSVINISCLVLLLQAELVSLCVCVCVCVRKRKSRKPLIVVWITGKVTSRTQRINNLTPHFSHMIGEQFIRPT